MTLRSRDLDLEKSRHVTFVKITFFIILHVLDIPDDFRGTHFVPLIRGLEKKLFDHVTNFFPHTLFVILDILDISYEFCGKSFKSFYQKMFSGFFHIDEYFDIQEQFSIKKFPIRDVLDIEFFGEFCGL